MAKAKITEILTGYERADKKTRLLGKKFHSHKLSGTVTVKTKRFLDSRLMRGSRELTHLFSYAKGKTYGLLFLTFGILSLFISFSRVYFGGADSLPLSELIIGAAFSALAVPLLLIDSPLPIILQGYKVTDVIFYEFFCLRRLYYTGAEPALHPIFGVLIGVCLAALSAIFSVTAVAVGIGIFFFTAMTFRAPEFAFFSSLLALPYFSLIRGSSVILAAVALLGVISFVRKTVFGKRVIFLEQYDLLIIIMMLGFLVSGIFLGGMDSFLSALLMISTSFGYFLASGTVTNRRLADSAISAITLSAIPAAIVSTVSYINRAVQGDPLGFLEVGISSTFESSESAAAFFLVASVLAMVLVKQSKRLAKKISAALLLLDLCALLLTGELMALMALAIGGLAYLAISKGRRMVLILPLLLLLPYLLLLIPGSAIAALPFRLFSDSARRVIAASLRAFRDNPLFGIGMGEESFIGVMDEYGLYSYPDGGNLFVDLALEAGVITVSAFVILLAVRLIHISYYRRYMKHSQVKKLSPFIAMAAFSLLVYGSFNRVFSDLTSFYLFWCIFGIGSGALRVAKAEHDDRIMYFEDERSNESAVVNIHLR